MTEAILFRRIALALEIERSLPLWDRLWDTRRAIWARARRRYQVNKLLAAGVAPRDLPSHWLA